MLSHKVGEEDVKPACSLSFTTVLYRVDVGELPAIVVVVAVVVFVVIMLCNTIMKNHKTVCPL